MVTPFGVALYGVAAITITVEVNSMATGTNYTFVGLPDNAAKESLLRVERTIKFIGYTMPRPPIVVNMAPVAIKKSGAAFDLLRNHDLTGNCAIPGRLSLDGEIRPIKGGLPIAIQARKEGFKGCIVPAENAPSRHGEQPAGIWYEAIRRRNHVF